MKKTEEINLETRNIYHKQHSRMVNDKKTMDRLNKMAKEEFFELEKGYFKNKKILDAGCGSTARNTIGFYEFGCRELTALDIGEDWKETALVNLKNYGVDTKVVELVAGNADNLPFEDETFDFVCLDGVLPHIPEIEQIEKIFAEMSRVTKKGGFFFTSYLSQQGSLMDTIDTAIRKYYRENDKFSDFVDNISPETLSILFEFIIEKLALHTKEDLNIDMFKNLFDEDLCITVQNTIQCHTRRNLSQEYVEKLLKKNGFDYSKRLKRYVERNNIRKYVSPLHFYHDNEFSKLFYSDGYIDCISQKIK